MMNGAKQWMVALACVAAGAAQAGMVKDKQGNVGFDTMAECQAAVSERSVGFYQPFSNNKPKLLNGAASVRQTTLREALNAPADVLGFCSKGVGRKQGRDGVSRVLQGKYVPLDPNMAVNAYSNRKGQLINIRMQKCDNWMDPNFQAVTARPVAQPVVTPAPVVTAPAPVVVAPAPVVTAPAPTAVAPVAAVAAPAGNSWLWLSAPVIACALLDCMDDGSSGTNGTSGTTGSK